LRKNFSHFSLGSLTKRVGDRLAQTVKTFTMACFSSI